jgi:sugar lactone lactonase YvrE
MRRSASALALVLALVPAAGLCSAAEARDKWDTRVLAHVPAPGFPAHSYVDAAGHIWEGTYVNPNGDTVPSRVFEFGGDGRLLRNYSVPGQSLAHEHGVQVATSDARGRLVLLDRTPSRALILDPSDGKITTYATFRDVHPCTQGGTPGDCSQSLSDGAPFADYAAWGPDGSLYVTDYAQAIVWRVPPGGGRPSVWLTDARLDGGGFGTAGIVLAPDRRTLLISQASGLGLNPGDPTRGHLYSVPIQPDGSAGTLTQRWESLPTDLPDGFAVAASGNIYLANVGLSAQLVQISPGGAELARFPSTFGTGDNGSPVPFDSPSGLAFLGTRLIVANQSALAGDSSHQVLLDVEAGEPGAPELIPADAGPATVKATSAVGLTGTVSARHGRRVTIRLSSALRTTPARVRVTSAGRTLATGTLRARTLRLVLRGASTLRSRVTLRPLRAGGALPATALQIR